MHIPPPNESVEPRYPRYDPWFFALLSEASVPGWRADPTDTSKRALRNAFAAGPKAPRPSKQQSQFAQPSESPESREGERFNWWPHKRVDSMDPEGGLYT